MPSCHQPVVNINNSNRGEICHCRHCRRQCKFFANRVNFSIFTHFLCLFSPKLLKYGEIKGVIFLAWNFWQISCLPWSSVCLRLILDPEARLLIWPYKLRGGSKQLKLFFSDIAFRKSITKVTGWPGKLFDFWHQVNFWVNPEIFGA